MYVQKNNLKCIQTFPNSPFKAALSICSTCVSVNWSLILNKECLLELFVLSPGRNTPYRQQYHIIIYNHIVMVGERVSLLHWGNVASYVMLLSKIYSPPSHLLMHGFYNLLLWFSRWQRKALLSIKPQLICR